jgi:hypothetical protein
MGWDGWMDARRVLWEWRKHPLASPNNDGLGSAFVYTTSRMNAIQKTINTLRCKEIVDNPHEFRHIIESCSNLSWHAVK